MENKKCPKCNLVSWASLLTCKRCGFSFTEHKAQPNARQTEQFKVENSSPQAIKKAGWNKIKWGLIIAIITITATIAIFVMGFQPTKVGFFAIITLTPLAAVLAGLIEIMTGISIFALIQKWEELPPWQGWLIGISMFVCVLFVVIIIPAIIIVSFF